MTSYFLFVNQNNVHSHFKSNKQKISEIYEKGNIMQVKFLFIAVHIKKDMTESLSILKGMRSCQKGVMGLKV